MNIKLDEHIQTQSFQHSNEAKRIENLMDERSEGMFGLIVNPVLNRMCSLNHFCFKPY